MPLMMILNFALVIGCAIHAVRSGRLSPWLFVILFFQSVGCLIYLLTQVLPELTASRAAHNAKRTVSRVLDPDAERRKAEAQLGMADTVANRLSLARAAAARKDFTAAIEAYQACLKGAYATDAPIMLELAQAQFAAGKAVESRATLDALKAANPGFRSPEGHLLYARALVEENRLDDAVVEFQALVDGGYPGEEARARYAVLLKQLQRLPEAKALQAEMHRRVESAPKFYGKNEQQWLDYARRELGA